MKKLVLLNVELFPHSLLATVVFINSFIRQYIILLALVMVGELRSGS